MISDTTHLVIKVVALAGPAYFLGYQSYRCMQGVMLGLVLLVLKACVADDGKPANLVGTIAAVPDSLADRNSCRSQASAFEHLATDNLNGQIWAF
jgi:hypothetical protein